MNSDEATVRHYLKSRFESTFEERVQRALEVRPQPLFPTIKTLPVPAHGPIKQIYVKKFVDLVDGA